MGIEDTPRLRGLTLPHRRSTPCWMLAVVLTGFSRVYPPLCVLIILEFYYSRSRISLSIRASDDIQALHRDKAPEESHALAADTTCWPFRQPSCKRRRDSDAKIVRTEETR